MSFETIGGAATVPVGLGSALGRIDQYELVRELGGGGFGTVYLAHDAVAGIYVAVKGLPPVIKGNAEELERIRENFALVSRLHHPYIAAALHLHRAQEVIYADDSARDKLRVFSGDTLMVMEYAPGMTLAKWRRQFPGGKVPLVQAVQIVWQIAQALDFAHEQHILHRDVKPSNIMVETRPDGNVVARLLDFGLAAEIRSSMGRISREIRDTSGTRPYMAPEQWEGRKQGPATDQYSLAVLLCELLTGAVPFASVFESGDPMVMMTAVCNREAELPDDCPRRRALLRALSKDPAQRFASCMEFMEAVAKSDAQSAPAKARPHTAKEGSKRRTIRVVPILVFLIAAVGGMIWHVWSDKKVPLYCIVDLSPGPNAQKYTISYSHTEPIGGWSDEHKTTKLVLRRIEPGTFIMGEDQNDESHRVTFTKPFYIGVFEVTQKQYELVTGGNPSKHKGPMRPVTNISVSQLRGSFVEYDWPTSRKVAPDSFMGRIRERTGFDGFELPTEAQWEYACRAGTTTLRYDGSDLHDVGRLVTLGRVPHNQKIRGWGEPISDFKKHKPDGKGGYLEFHTSVGMYKPNAWGLYDMYGNVWESCVSRMYDAYGENPLGKLGGPRDSRPRCGGGWLTVSPQTSSRGWMHPWDRWDDTGFRLVLNADEGCNSVKDKETNGITKTERPDGLIHRWSFNGNLKDSVGNCDGKTVGGNVTFGDGRVRIRPDGGYVDLGANVLPGGRKNEYTIEIWATKHSVQNWARVFHIPDNWHQNDYFWTWNTGSDPKKWRVKFAGCTSWDVSPVDGTGTGVETHFVVAYGHDEKGRPYYRLCALRGEKKVYWRHRIGLLGEMFHSHAAFFLGHSYPSDKNAVTADASYNEVRIWNRALTHDEIMRSAKLGPDKLP